MTTVENIELNPSIMDKFYLQDTRVGYWIWKSPNHTSSEKTRLRSSNNPVFLYIIKVERSWFTPIIRFFHVMFLKQKYFPVGLGFLQGSAR